MTDSSENDWLSLLRAPKGESIRVLSKNKKERAYSDKGYGHEREFTAPVRITPETLIRSSSRSIGYHVRYGAAAA